MLLGIDIQERSKLEHKLIARHGTLPARREAPNADGGEAPPLPSGVGVLQSRQFAAGRPKRGAEGARVGYSFYLRNYHG